MRKNIFKDVKEEWEDYLETGKDKIDKEQFEKESDSEALLNCYEEWREKGKEEIILDSYNTAARLLKKHEISSLSEKRINELIKKAGSSECCSSGIFFSAVINELYENSEIHLYGEGFNFIGCCNKDKKIVVGGDCENVVGAYMKSGEIVVEGDCKSLIGNYMKGGEIVVKGDCEDGIGSEMKSGKIKICGDNFNPKEQISEYAERGEIYHNDELVWKDGEFIGEEK